MSNQLISVVVPIFQVDKYLVKCIKSILNQTYKKIEIILVDDGSYDNCSFICDEFANYSDKIFVIHKKNGGLSNARNCGMDLSNGEFIGFVDSDDWIEPTMYESLLRLSSNEYNILPMTCVVDETEEGVVKHVANKGKRCESKKEYIQSLLLHKGDVAVWSKLYRTESVINYRFDEQRLNEDLLYIFSIEQTFSKILYTNEIGYHYLIRSSSISHSFGKSFYGMVDNSDYIYNYISNEYPDLILYAERFRIYQRIAFLLSYPIFSKKEDYIYYRRVLKDLRILYFKGIKNKWLSSKDKIYLTLLCISPLLAQSIKAILKRIFK